MANEPKALVIAVVVSAALVAVAFGVSLDNEFLYWDDRHYLHDNPKLQALTPGNLWWMLTQSSIESGHYNWQPLTALSHALDLAFWGYDAGKHRLGNLVLHGISAILVFLISCEILRSTAPAWTPRRRVAAALLGMTLFAIHPLRVESVVWLAERKDVLYGMFYLLAVSAYLIYRRDARTGWRILASIAGLSAVMSKPMAVSLPVVLLLLDYWPHRRWSWGVKGMRAVVRSVVTKLDFVAYAALASVMAIIAQTRGGAISSLDDVDVLTRILNAGHSVLFYCQKWLLPTALSPVYPFPDPVLKGELSAWLELAIVLGFTVVTIVLARRGHRGWLAAWLIYIVGLLPALGLIQVGIQAAADRYTYIPMVGLAIAAGAGAVGLAVNLPSAFSRVAHGGLVAAIVLGLVLATRVQSEMWHDDRILWTNALSIYPAQIPIAHINLGNTYVMSGEREIAIQHYKNALRVDPDNVVAHTNLAWSHAHLNQFDEALAYANGAIEIDKDSVLGWLARGLSLHVTGQRASAIDAYEMVLNLDPSNGDAATNRDNLIHGQSLATPHRAPTD